MTRWQYLVPLRALLLKAIVILKQYISRIKSVDPTIFSTGVHVGMISPKVLIFQFYPIGIFYVGEKLKESIRKKFHSEY